ncbi:MAG TPA: DUF998 domain-containing protein [Saprospiraceae bacterium]|nr:DUF998 domain-containing protein [Saprospiraceae bacterium]HPN69450.1 DUF998 domain-containing protein [Saprospiraceae bacterium]
MEILPNLVILLSSLSLLSLWVLHFVSPEFKPSWRMISEYALGKYKWLITTFFYLWSVASIILSVLLWSEVSSTWGKIGVILVLISGIGAFMGGLFDLKHKNHGLAFLLGTPTLPIGALLVCYHLLSKQNWQIHETSILYSTHSTWISFILMAISMVVLMSGYKKTGLPMGPDVEPPKELPKGVIGVNGYFNRLLVFCYILWLIVMANVIN